MEYNSRSSRGHLGNSLRKAYNNGSTGGKAHMLLLSLESLNNEAP